MTDRPEAVPEPTEPLTAVSPGAVSGVPAQRDESEALEIARERAQVLQEHRKWLIEADRESSVSFDKVLVTLSAGALGISVSQARAGALWRWSLELSWAFFTISLLAMLLSYLTARRDLQRSIAAIDWKLVNGEAGPPEERRAWHEAKTTTLNHAALICLVAGICLLVAYASRNLG